MPRKTVLPSDTGQEPLEVLDSAGKPLLIMSRDSVLRQKLPHKLALVCLFDGDGRVYIHKRSRGKPVYPGMWNISAAGHVRAGEAPLDAALRELERELGIRGLELTLVVAATASPETENAAVWLYRTNRISVVPRPDPQEIEEGMFVDCDELEAMIRDLPGLLAPALLWAAKHIGRRQNPAPGTVSTATL